MYLVFPVFTAKPISLQAFNNTSAFLSIVLISSPIKIHSGKSNSCNVTGIGIYLIFLISGKNARKQEGPINRRKVPHILIKRTTNQFHGLQNRKDSLIIPIQSRINLIARIDTYFLRSIVILSYRLRIGFPRGPLKFWKHP